MDFGKVRTLLVNWGSEFGSYSTEPGVGSRLLVISSIDEQQEDEEDKDLEGITEKSNREGADEDGKGTRNFIGFVNSTSNKRENGYS